MQPLAHSVLVKVLCAVDIYFILPEQDKMCVQFYDRVLNQVSRSLQGYSLCSVLCF